MLACLAVPTYTGLELVDHPLELLGGLADVCPEHQHHVTRQHLLEHGHTLVVILLLSSVIPFGAEILLAFCRMLMSEMISYVCDLFVYLCG